MRSKSYAVSMITLCLLPAAASAWNPANGDWTKTEPGDLRVMTWNVLDGIRSEADKTEDIPNTQWEALARIVAALKPDVLMLQECGDNGCFNCVDSQATLETVIDLFLHGGTDPFLGGAVTAYVQAYDPAYDLPFVYVSTASDGFNRNVVLSRFPFADLNGDTKSTYANTPFMVADAYQNGGTTSSSTAGRGFQFVEIDLPDGTYAGDLVAGNTHLKAGAPCGGDHNSRLTTAKLTAYFVDYWYNGAGSGIPDPNSKILDTPAATTILDDDTPVVLGGDWNEEEGSCGRGPAAWMTQAEFAGGTDGTDRDRTDATYDASGTFCLNNPDTKSGSKLDYVAWQDSIATERLSFVFKTSEINECADFPPEFSGAFFQQGLSSDASDHLPVIVDLIVPLAGVDPGSCCQSNGSCIETTQLACEGAGGVFGGTGTTCLDDADGDGVADVCDICPGGDDNVDNDGDDVPDFCDPCPADNPDDTDGDGVCDSDDICPGGDDNVDNDGDGVPDFCDPCPADNPDDSDGDGVCDSDDICPGGDDNVDNDGDGVPDFCDPCPADNPDDTDGDGVCDSDDPCPADNPDDSDGDGVCDSDDICPGFDDGEDPDEDMIPSGCDPCPEDPDNLCQPSCSSFADFADMDHNGIRDEACTWWECVGGLCVGSNRDAGQGDIGGFSGACPIDGACDINDKFHAQNCFANQDTDTSPGYPCEQDNPEYPANSLNVDAVGFAGDCALDGVCDINDAFGAENCFANQNTDSTPGFPCTCDGPAPQAPAVAPRREAVARAGLTLWGPATARPGELLEIDVTLDEALKALRGYQLHVGVRGGRGGTLELLDMTVREHDRDYVYRGSAAQTWMAFNTARAQLLNGVSPQGVATPAGAYLATLTFRVSGDARGTFEIDLLVDDTSRIPQGRTFLFATPYDPIAVSATRPAIITVDTARKRVQRVGTR